MGQLKWGGKGKKGRDFGSLRQPRRKGANEDIRTWAIVAWKFMVGNGGGGGGGGSEGGEER